MKTKVLKKLGLIALTALLAASAAACKASNQQQLATTSVPATDTTGAQTQAPEVSITGEAANLATISPDAAKMQIQMPEGYSCQFVRIPYSESVNSMQPYVIKTSEKLREALETNSLTGLSGNMRIEDYTKQYNEAFFKTGYLLVFNLTFSSGSVTPKIKEVKLDNGTVNIVTDGEMQGDVGTSDMASHMCLLALDREKFPETSAFQVAGRGSNQSAVGKTE